MNEVESNQALAKLRRRSVEDPETGCILWAGGKTTKGYGEVYFNGKLWRAHRLAATASLMLAPDSELYVLHRCDTPGCCRLDHLFVGTQGDNVRDCIAKGRFRGGRTPGRGTKLTVEDV